MGWLSFMHLPGPGAECARAEFEMVPSNNHGHAHPVGILIVCFVVRHSSRILTMQQHIVGWGISLGCGNSDSWLYGANKHCVKYTRHVTDTVSETLCKAGET